MRRATSIRTRSGLELPRLGQGTWRMGETPARRTDEVRALQLGLDLGLNLIDTAEMYASGGAETVVAEAIRGRRDKVVLVSKVLPQNASRAGTLRAAERSLERLETDRIDLYLLHWAGSHPLEETLAAFERLVQQGKILHYGVSNFDTSELRKAQTIPAGGAIAANQVLYNPLRRGIEWRLLPWCRERDVAVMAYSPFDQGALAATKLLEDLAARHTATPHAVVLAWILRNPNVVVIPKAVRGEHVRENAAARDIRLSERDLAAIDDAFPRPDGDVPLEVL